jgi:nucleoid-associated protein YgaU
MSRQISWVVVASLALAGCDLTDKQDLQYDDARNPFYKQAQQDLDTNNAAAAAGDYEQALGANPKLVGAHYQLGHIYDEKLDDPIASIYHFQMYVKLAPNGDKVDEVKALIDKESQAFAAGLPNSPTQSADDYARLQADNAALKKQVDDAAHTIAQLQTQLGKHHKSAGSAAALAAATAPVATPAAPDASQASAAAPPETASVALSTPGAVAAEGTSPRALPLDSTNGPTAVAPGSPAPADAGPSRTYTVVKGDSLWKIAHKMYPGDTKNGVDKIQEANKDAINGKPLKIGQVLIIPQ